MSTPLFASRVQGIFSAKTSLMSTSGLATAFQKNLGNCFSTKSPTYTQQRQYSSSKGENSKNKGVPLAFFSDYNDGKAFTVNPPVKEDKSAVVGFVKPPKGYDAHPEQALKSGFQGLWIRRNEYSDTTSIYTLAFDDTFAGSIDQYMQERTQTFIDRYQSSDGKHYSVDLGSVVTDHLTRKNGVQCKAALFSTGQTSLYEQPLLGKLIMLMKTPGGFWELGLHAPIKHLLAPSTHTAFTEAIRDLKIFWREGEHADMADNSTKVTNKQSLLD